MLESWLEDVLSKLVKTVTHVIVQWLDSDHEKSKKITEKSKNNLQEIQKVQKISNSKSEISLKIQTKIQKILKIQSFQKNAQIQNVFKN